ncbi:MAG: hypothetical protein NTW87_31200, partial [Planctomycetota bacterium]|nr:hypothetical protein [Planctomycetota bacterium]
MSVGTAAVAEPPKPDNQAAPVAQPVPGQAPNVVLLTCQAPDTNESGAETGILVRELFRQAFLIAARDGLGLATRDGALREPLPQPASAFNMKTRSVPGKHVIVTLSRGEAADAKALLQKTFPLSPGKYVNYLEVAEVCERLSRTEFLQVLKDSGYQGAPNPVKQEAAPSARVEELLRKVSFYAPFEALRETHAELRKEGESPQLLGAVARAYANLAVQLDFCWSPMSKAFAARAMLYAQRAVAVKQTPAALADRAYRQCFIAYDWMCLVANVGFDEAGLFTAWGIQALADSLTAVLPTLPGLPQSAKAELDARRAAMPPGEPMALTGPRAKDPNLGGALDRMLNEAEGQSRKKIMDALLAAAVDDTAEPSWAVLGRAIQEVGFAQAFRGCAALFWRAADRNAKRVQAMTAWADDHPCRAALEAFQTEQLKRGDAVAAALKGLKISNAKYFGRNFVNSTQRSERDGFPDFALAQKTVVAELDGVARDLEAALHEGPRRKMDDYARWLRAVSPLNPYAFSTLVEKDKNLASTKPQDWHSYLWHEEAVQGLAWSFQSRGKTKELHQLLAMCVKRNNSYWSFRLLARHYPEDAAVRQEWKALLDEYLAREQDKYGLNGFPHAQVLIFQRLPDDTQQGGVASGEPLMRTSSPLNLEDTVTA